MRINNTDTLQSNETNKSVNNTIILSSCDSANNITKTASTNDIASLATKISNEESLEIINNQETDAKCAHPKCKKNKSSKLTDNSAVNLTQLNENTLYSDKNALRNKKDQKKDPKNSKQVTRHLLVCLKKKNTMLQYKRKRISKSNIQRTHRNYMIKNNEVHSR